MVEGFALVDAELGWTGGGSGWWVVRIEHDLEPHFTRSLRITLQQGRDGATATVLISGATTFRVQNEREMHDFWLARHNEGIAQGMFYTVKSSGYLGDFDGGVSATAQPQKHYILSAEEDCVEFIGPGWGHDLRIEIHQPSAEVR